MPALAGVGLLGECVVLIKLQRGPVWADRVRDCAIRDT